MWVLQGGNVAKNNLTIMMEILHSWPKKTNENFGNAMWALWGDNVTKCSLTIMVGQKNQ
jgi:hypothetical protein